MNFKRYDSILEIKEIWERIYNASACMTFFQSYNWNLILEKKYVSEHFFKYNGDQLSYFVFDNKIIAPLLINKKKRTIILLGQNASSDYLSFVFSEVDYVCMLDVFKTLSSVYNGYTFILDKISEYNPVNKVCDQICKYSGFSIEEKDCVHVLTQTGTSLFFNSLKKSTKRNYKTRRNHLLRDDCSFHFEITNEPLSSKECEALYSIYTERRNDCQNNEMTIKRKAKKAAVSGLKSFGLYNSIDVLSEYSMENKVFLCRFYINDDIAAFYEGVLNADKRLAHIARVSINIRYYQYSPGMIMLIDAMDEIKQYVDCFDLTRGTEDYKFELGGHIHHNYKYTIPLSELLFRDELKEIILKL